VPLIPLARTSTGDLEHTNSTSQRVPAVLADNAVTNAATNNTPPNSVAKATRHNRLTGRARS
jgi:hypothetical protein